MKNIKVGQISSAGRSSKSILERWEQYVPESRTDEYRPALRALGLFRTDSVNISFIEAAQRRLRQDLQGERTASDSPGA